MLFVGALHSGVADGSLCPILPQTPQHPAGRSERRHPHPTFYACLV